MVDLSGSRRGFLAKVFATSVAFGASTSFGKIQMGMSNKFRNKSMVVVSENGLNVREGPGLKKPIRTTLNKGARVIFLGGFAKVDGYVWYNVLFQDSSSGWAAISSDREVFLEFSDELKKKEVVSSSLIKLNPENYFVESSNLIDSAIRSYSLIVKDLTITPGYARELNNIVKLLEESVIFNDANKVRVTTRLKIANEIARLVDLPVGLIVGIWYRENSKMRVDCYFHNGRPLGRSMTLNGKRYFFKKGELKKSAEAVFSSSYFVSMKKKLKLSYFTTSLAHIATFGEIYNGLDIRRDYKINHSYSAAGTQGYSKGFRTFGGFKKHVVDKRPGVLVIAYILQNRK